MRHLSAFCVLPLAILAALPAQAQAEMVSITPEQIGQIFCIGSLGNDMTPVFSIVNEDLRSFIDRAAKRSDEYAQAHPGDKPPLGDGIPWRTWQDYADGCTVAETAIKDLVATVVINYTFSEAPSANYANTLILLPDYPENGPPYIWRIADVDLGDGNTLRSFLGSIIETE